MSTHDPSSDFPIDAVRAQFPALNQDEGFLFFDNAAGAQVPHRVIEAVTDHMLHRQVQRGGPYRKSQEVDATIARARASVADFLNADDPAEVAFGLNATSFIRIVSLAIGMSLDDRPEIVATDLDHEANVATWVALERFGATIRWWRSRLDDRGLGPVLNADDLEPLLSSRTRVVACPLASNGLGTRIDVAAAAARAHAVGAELFVDAVHYAPHGPIDVKQMGMDYLVVSTYKMFGPHAGFLWGRRDLLQRLPTFREDFLPNVPPEKIEAGTTVHENIAGVDAAIDYLADLGGGLVSGATNGAPRRDRLARAMRTINDYEHALSTSMLEVMQAVPGLTIYGVTDPQRLDTRVPTFCFTIDGHSPPEVSDRLAAADIGIRHGNMYAPRLMVRLGVPVANRVSLVHYNTFDEIDRFGKALTEIARS